MKKKLFALLVVVMACAFVGCGSTPEQLQAWREKTEAEFWDSICNHEPNRYVESENMVYCKWPCKKEHPNLTYEEFCKCVNFLDHRALSSKSKEEYCIKAYVEYREVDPIYLEFAEMLPKNGTENAELEMQLGALNTWIEKSNNILDMELNIAKGKKLEELEALIQSHKDTISVLGDAIEITQKVINFNNLLDDSGEPQVLCEDFIDFVNDFTPSGNYVFIMQLDVLSEGLDVFWKYYKIHEFNCSVYGASLDGNDCFASWNHFPDPGKWVEDLEKQNVEDLGAVFADNVKIADKRYLPAVVDVCDWIINNELTEAGERLATEYIMFRINYYFENQIGITLQEYVKALDELAQELNKK